ncbi:MAG: hypothetical protein HYX63_05065 [Gammaproteobacteria bacterium]|nr:hypothetical protein [Gammaproteobacteria bacterium]
MPQSPAAQWLLSLLLAFALGAGAEALAPEAVPAPLKPWIPWVLQDIHDRECPYLFNADARHCVWPGKLALDLDEHGGTFSVQVAVYESSWLSLPGRVGQWPDGVRIDGAIATVIAHQGVPAVELWPGKHTIDGRYGWPGLPETLQVPADFGVIALKVAGREDSTLNARRLGQLWLKSKSDATLSAKDEDRLEFQVFRQVIDELPMQVVTQLKIDVTGKQREVSLVGALLPGTLPMAVDSPLPARLDRNGELRVQVRPGNWILRITTRHTAPVTSLAPLPPVAPWPSDEIWTFAARTSLRLVDVQGGTAVDPRQTQLPPDWQGLPAYRVTATAGLKFVERRRGDPDPEPDQLNLTRQLWLDFDGAGYTINDTLAGRMTRRWRLEVGPSLELGRVLLQGEPQFITTVAGASPGVEVRHGAVQLVADSRYRGDMHTLSAVGWAHAVSSLGITLHLPPGWRLWSASGIDNVPDTWLHRWTLLDIFLVLIITVTLARLWHWQWAAVGALCLVLIWHESDAPRQVWLHLLAALAVLKVLPAGRIQTLVSAYRNGALLVLIALSVNFMIEQVRLGLYPQLEHPYAGTTTMSTGAAAAPAPVVAEKMDAPASRQAAGAVDALSAGVGIAESTVNRAVLMAEKSKPRRVDDSNQHEFDPKAMIQTGPGLPEWRWNAVQLQWNGPVGQGQTLGLVLLSPRINLLLALARVGLLAGLIGIFLRASFGELRRLKFNVTPAVGMLLMLLAGASYWPSARAALPDVALLEELKRRLTLAPDCLPNCAELPRLYAALQGGELTLRLEAHAALDVGFPLPGRAEQWAPATVLVDGSVSHALFLAPDGVLWLMLPAGMHDVVLSGPVPPRASFQIPFQLIPQRVDTAIEGFRVDGVKPDGSSEPQLIFTRLATATAQPATLEASALPAFFRVERTLHLGLDWRVETRVLRLTPPGTAAALAIPLLTGESVTTPEIHLTDRKVNANFSAEQGEFGWSSVLSKADSLTLVAPTTTDWVETWRADVSPLWHAELSGIPVIHHQTESGVWLPEWQPWPTETVNLKLTRPQGVAGQTLTIDRSQLHLRPGQRATDTTLEFTLRSSQGGQHSLTLPDGASLQSFVVNGVPQPIRQEGTKVTMPVVPGEQQVTALWRSDEGLRARFVSPAWSLGAPSVNAMINVELPQDRWTLLVGGPRLGPAVLFWGVLLVSALIAIALGRSRFTPLSAWQWLLLFVGLSQTTVINALVVVGWLVTFALRERLPAPGVKWRFNLLQVALTALTLVALSMLFDAIRRGLLGNPSMQIAGNGSSAYALNWFQDRVSAAAHPTIWVVSVSLWVYRGLMLAWSLWLAFALLTWLRWAWIIFARDGVWRSVQLLSSRTIEPTT